MNFDRLEITAKGITPIIFCNPRTANVLDPEVRVMKRLTSKKTKTDQDYEEILQVEWRLKLYWDDEIGLYVPWEMLSSAFHEAAKRHKLGRKTPGVSFTHHLGYPLLTKNHTNLAKLEEDPETKLIKLVKIDKKLILSSRPVFKDWKIKFDLEVDTSYINVNEVIDILSTMSCRVGIGSWRPSSPKPGHYGKFMIESLVHIDGKNGKTKTLIGEA